MKTTAPHPHRRRARSRRVGVAAVAAAALVAAACGDDADTGDAEAVDLTLGAPGDCEENPFCIPGLRDTYGVDLAGGFVPVDYVLIPDSVLNGAVDIGTMFSTDPPLGNPELVVLEDDLGMFAAENILPVGAQELEDAYGDDLTDALDAVSSVLTTEDLVAMNGRYVDDNDDADAIAADWLADQALPDGAERDGPTIRIGAQDFPEQAVLSEIYFQALESAGFDVRVQNVSGTRELLFASFDSGDVNLALEYLGSELNFLSEGEATTDVDESLDNLRAQLAERDMVAWEPAPAANSNVFVMTRERAEELNITSLSDLAGLGD